METKIITNSPSETKALGERLAKQVIKNGLQDKAVIIELIGNLGSGKTTFVKGFAKKSSIRKLILSPTFVIFKKFKISIPPFKLLYHFDCYRLKDHKDLNSLGFKDICSDPKNIILIEWAEIVKKGLPNQKITINFKVIGESKRQAKIRGISFVDN